MQDSLPVVDQTLPDRVLPPCKVPTKRFQPHGIPLYQTYPGAIRIQNKRIRKQAKELFVS